MENNFSDMRDELLIDYILGEATDAEKLQVQQWLTANAANMEYYQQMKLLWDESKHALPMVDADTEAALGKFYQNIDTRKQGRVIPFFGAYGVLKMAGVLLLLVAVAGMVYFINNNQPESQIADNSTNVATQQNVAANANQSWPVPQMPETQRMPVAINVSENDANAVTPKSAVVQKEFCQSKEYVCNSTPCPLEICITQKSDCKDGKPPRETSYCSIIQPAESNKICYKEQKGRPYEHCGTTIEEISIQRLSTGETIVLNDRTKLTAESLFSHITGNECGEIIAGVFQRDCDNNNSKQVLTLGNNSGEFHIR